MIKRKQLQLEKGRKKTQEREFKTLLSLVEKGNYVQFLLTRQGKYQPELELVTVSKKDLSKIDNLNLYGGIYDSYEINYWHSKFIGDHEEIILTKVKNLKFNEIELDTIQTKFRVSSNGAIVQQ